MAVSVGVCVCAGPVWGGLLFIFTVLVGVNNFEISFYLTPFSHHHSSQAGSAGDVVAAASWTCAHTRPS